jgi:hypothetical protein
MSNITETDVPYYIVFVSIIYSGKFKKHKFFKKCYKTDMLKAMMRDGM